MNFFSFDKSEKATVQFKPEVKNFDLQPPVVRTISQPQQAIQPINTKKESTMSYADIQKQIAELQAKAEQARKEELSGIINQIKLQIAEYGLTASDLGLTATRGRKAGSGPAKPKVVMYRDGEFTWAGPNSRGKLPKWIAQVKEAHGDNYLNYLAKFKVAE